MANWTKVRIVGGVFGNVKNKTAYIEWPDSFGQCLMGNQLLIAKNNQETEHLISAAPDMAEELENCKRLLVAIIEGYSNHDINHVDFRVKVTKWAEETLPDVEKALSKAKGE